MALWTMFDGIPNSPVTTLSTGIDSDDTTIVVVDGSVLPDAPNICSLGLGEDTETIYYGTKVSNTLSDVIRDYEEISAAKSWDSGTSVARMFTNYDYAALVANIGEVDDKKNLIQLAHSAIPQNTSGSDYNILSEVYFYADSSRFDFTNLAISIKEHVDSGVTGQCKVTISDQSGTEGHSFYHEFTATTSTTLVTTLYDNIWCSGLNNQTIWKITFEGKVTSGTGRYYLDRFVIKGVPTENLFTDETLLSIVPDINFNSASFQLIDTKAFACSHVMDVETMLRAYVQCTLGTGVTGVEIKIIVSAYNTNEQVTITCSASSTVYNGAIYMPMVAQPYQVDVWARVSGGSGIATLDYYEMQMEL